IILAAMVLNVLLVIDQELLIPQMIPKLVRKHDEIEQSGSGGKSFAVRAMQDDADGLLNVARYHPSTAATAPWMEVVDIVKVDKDFMPVSHILADKAQWDGKQWQLTNGRVVTGLKPAASVSKEM